MKVARNVFYFKHKKGDIKTATISGHQANEQQTNDKQEYRKWDLYLIPGPEAERLPYITILIKTLNYPEKIHREIIKYSKNRTEKKHQQNTILQYTRTNNARRNNITF